METLVAIFLPEYFSYDIFIKKL